MRTKNIILDILLFAFTDLLKRYEQTSVDLIKIKSLSYYVKGIKIVRSAYLGIFLLLLVFILMINGFFLIHLAFFYYIPWSRDMKLITLFALGICYFLIPLGIHLYYVSQKRWMKLSKADKLMHTKL